MISRLVLENFKSYAGVREIGPLHKRFSAIVGPNGSGKSNVIDALLFVFGKRAKKLRLNKVSELIHRSCEYQDLEYARVSVYFQEIIDEGFGDDDFEIVPESEFVIARTAFRNNSSKYQIDERNSTFTEVTQLLMSHGVDLDNNRFLILQGEVEQIAMMKPKAQTPHEEGLLEYLEDIIGSNKYVAMIEEVSKEVDTLNERRAEKLARVRTSEKERDNLSEAKVEAEEFLDQERAIRFKQNILHQIWMQESRKNAHEISEKKEKLVEKLQYEQDKLRKHTERLVELDHVHTKSVAEYELINKELRRVEEEFNSYERRQIKCDEDLRHLRQQVKKHKACITKEQQKSDTLQQSMIEAEENIPRAEAALESALSKVLQEETKLQEVMDSLQGETASLRESLEQKQAELAPEQTQLQAMLSRAHQIDTATGLILEPSQTAAKRLALTESKLAELTNDNGKSNALAEALVKKDEYAQRITELEDRIANLQADEGTFVAQVRAAVTSSEEAKAALASNPPRNGVVERIMEEAVGGCLQGAGVCGRLGDLGRVPARYDMAVSTACSNLDYIVCDTTDGAKSCINLLKEGRVGRGNFIALDKIPAFGAKLEHTPPLPDGAQRLFDLIDTDPKYRAAFYMGLRDTLICEDLDTAVRVAYQGNKCAWRVVTVDGGLIDISGAMSGGGQAVKKGGMKMMSREGATVTAEEVKELDLNVGECEQRLQDCRNCIVETKQELHQVKRASDVLSDTIEKLKIDIGGLPAMKEELKRQIAVLKKSSKLSAEDQHSIAIHEQELTELQSTIDEKRAIVDALMATVRELQSEILEVGGPRLKLQQSRLDKASSAADEARTQLSTLSVQLKTSRRNLEKANTAIEKAQRELAKSEKEIEKIEGEVAKMEHSAMEVKAAYESARDDARSKKNEAEASLREVEALKSQVQTIKQVEVDIQNQLEEYEKGIRENKHKLEYWQKQLADIRRTHEVDAREYTSYVRDLSRSRVRRSFLGGDGYEHTDAKDDSESQAQIEVDQIDEVAPLIDHDEEFLSGYDKDELKHDINMLEQQRDKLRSNVNMGALEEYRKKDREYSDRMADLEVVTQSRDEVRGRYEQLRRKRLDEFMCGFGDITLKLKEMYQMITLGGDAELELLDSLDPFSEGIVFSVRPPKKSWKHISNLSGGEKTLSSLALVFALHYFKPTPLYVMDEIDAALDFKNVSIVANYIKERTRDAQFVIISLRNNMFELADRLVGIYKTHDVTKSVTINPKLFEDQTSHTSLNNTKSTNNARRSSVLHDRTNASMSDVQDT